MSCLGGNIRRVPQGEKAMLDVVDRSLEETPAELTSPMLSPRLFPIGRVYTGPTQRRGPEFETFG